MDTLFFHPQVVHVPLALAVLMPLVTAGLLVAWWRRWLPPRAWLLAVLLQSVLVGSSFAALQSGEAEEDRVERFVPESALETHEQAAEQFSWSGAGVLVVMLLAWIPTLGPLLKRSRGGAGDAGRKAGLATGVVAALGTLAVLGLGYRTGDRGGQLVYTHGAALAHIRPPTEGGQVGAQERASGRSPATWETREGDAGNDDDD